MKERNRHSDKDGIIEMLSATSANFNCSYWNPTRLMDCTFAFHCINLFQHNVRERANTFITSDLMLSLRKEGDIFVGFILPCFVDWMFRCKSFWRLNIKFFQRKHKKNISEYLLLYLLLQQNIEILKTFDPIRIFYLIQFQKFWFINA